MTERIARFNELTPSTLPFVEGRIEGHKERKNYSIVGQVSQKIVNNQLRFLSLMVITLVLLVPIQKMVLDFTVTQLLKFF